MKKKFTISDDDKKLFREAVQNINLPPKDKSRDHQPKRKYIKTEKKNAKKVEWVIVNKGFYRAGLQKKQFEKLSRGKFNIEAMRDLHGLNVNDAKQQVEKFLSECIARDDRCVKIIHGKGLHAVNNRPVIKPHLDKWLQQNMMVLAVCLALVKDGGAGASYIFLKRH